MAVSVVRRILLFCFLASVCEGFDIQAAGVAAAGIAADFSPNARALGLLFSCSTLGLLIGALFGGKVADAKGRKTILLASVASFGLASLLTAAAPTVAWICCGRFVTGLGLGGALPSIIALAAEADPNESRRSYIAILYRGAALASLTSLLVAAAHWRWVFGVGGLLALALAPLLRVFMPESASFALVRKMRFARASKWNDGIRTLPARLNEVWSVRTFLLWIGFCLSLLTVYLLLNWLPTLLVSRGLDHAQAAAAQIGFNVGGAATILAISRLLDTRSRRIVIVLTFALIPCALALLALLPSKYLGMTVLSIMLGGAVLASQSIVYALAPRIYPTAIRGFGLGTAVAAGRVGAIAGPILVGFILSKNRGATDVLLTLVPLVTAAGLATLWLDALTRNDVRSEDLNLIGNEANFLGSSIPQPTGPSQAPDVRAGSGRIAINSIDMGCIREWLND
jgi:AAHS family 3-hydroxyphenylpropionic acid transporter